MDPECFVRSLEIADFVEPVSNIRTRRWLERKDDAALDAALDAAVDSGSVVSFVSNISLQKKQDVLDSTMLAQLAASKKHDRTEDPKNWYKFYQHVLANVGWNIQNFQFEEYQSADKSFKISDVVLVMLESAIGNDATLKNVLQNTIKSLEHSREGLELFGSKSSSGNKGNFQIVPCTIDKSGQVTVTFLGSHFKTTHKAQNYFFFTWNSASINLFFSAQTMTLNEERYSGVREQIKKKLGRHTEDFVVDLEI